MLSFDNIEWQHEPYPFGVAYHVLEAAAYESLVETFPSPVGGQYVQFKGGNKKLSLSEVNNPRGYFAFLEICEPWRDFFSYVKSTDFMYSLFERIAGGGIPLPGGKFKSRFEFSAMPADGGCLRPHTDMPSKVVTLVLPMCRPGDWLSEWGGGTDILKPKSGSKPLQDYKAEFDEFDKVATVGYNPNQALVFIKNDVSWHGVRCSGPAGTWRLSATVNVERAA